MYVPSLSSLWIRLTYFKKIWWRLLPAEAYQNKPYGLLFIFLYICWVFLLFLSLSLALLLPRFFLIRSDMKTFSKKLETSKLNSLFLSSISFKKLNKIFLYVWKETGLKKPKSSTGLIWSLIHTCALSFCSELRFERGILWIRWARGWTRRWWRWTQKSQLDREG